MFSLKFDSAMKKGWFWLAFLTISNSLLQFIRTDLDSLTKVVLFFILILNAGILVQLVDRIGSNKDNSEELIIKVPNFSPWGYVWRGYIAIWSMIPILVFIKSIVPIQLPTVKGQFSTFDLILLEPLFFAMAAIAIWTLFSKNRVGQLKFIVSGFRGY